ncbi:MAG TPA: M28 family peptidase [Thermoanaerobaculia bacterium]
MAEPHEQSVDGVERWTGRDARALALMLALFGLALALVVARHRPPPPRPAGAPAAEFSAVRAREVQRRLVGDGRPHPVGSAADDRVRQTIVDVLAGLGYQPRVEEGFACHWGGTCARVRNVVARRDGREPGAAVAIVAHYDSVEAGPGASDDLAGVAAILEIARALAVGPPPRHPVLLLLDEGEEAGLLGAAAFEAASPEAAEVKAVVNLEARGTEGPSFMFETSGDNRWMIDAWAPRAPRPVTTSVAAFIYALLPNDTDLTVFRRHHLPGLNFAYIGGANSYHTPADDLANASPASLQHEGENALAAVTALADATELASPPKGGAAFFDLFGLWIVRWPAGWMLGMAAAALLLVLAVAVTGVAGRAMGGRDLALGLLAMPAMLLATALLAYGTAWALTAAGPLAAPWLAHPLPALAAFWLLPLAVAAAIARRWGRRRPAAPLGLWAGIWILWAALGLALAWQAPPASYVLVLPALVAGLCGVLFRVWRGGGSGGARAAAIVPGTVAAVLWWGVLPPLYEGLGVAALPLVATLLAVLFATLAPLTAAAGRFGRRLWVAALAATLLAVLVALPQPRFSPRSPQHLTYTFFQDGDSGKARWLVQARPLLPAAVRRAAAFAPGLAFPWSPPGSRSLSAPATPLAAAVPPPDLQLLESTVAGGKRHLRLRLVSRRGAPVGTLVVPARARPTAVRIDGQPVPETGWRSGKPQAGADGWLFFSDATLPAAGCELDLELDESGPVELYALDQSLGLPASGAALIAARPPTAVPIQQGDTTMLSRRLKI